MTEATGTRIVVAEDDLDILDLLVFTLTEAGFDAVAVSDGVAALDAIEANPPRLAILDISMPGMSGIEVLRLVRASKTISNLDVILLSGHTRDSDIDIGFAAGASDYVIKPFSPRELLQRVSELTAQNHALRQTQIRDLDTHEIILEVGRAIRAASDTQQALDVMCAAMGERLGVDRVISHTTGVGHGAQPAAQWHRPELQPLTDLSTLPGLGGIAEELWLSAEFKAQDDLLELEAEGLEGLSRTLLQQSGARAVIMVPIGLDDRVIGMIYVVMVDQPRAWTTSETDVVRAVAGFVARAVVAVEHRAHQLEYVDRIEKLDRQKSDFLATVSHELRTPLTSISGYLELLQGEDACDLSGPQQQGMLDAISRNTIRLRSLIEDVMVLSRIEGGVSDADFVEVPIRRLVTRVGDELSVVAKGRSIELKIDAGAQAGSVLGDRTSLHRAMLNILSNAIKFSRPGGVVTITVTLDQVGRRAHITCQDHGVGIPAHDLADLFTRFFRASNATDQVIPGTGLGLSIAKQIVEDHHGELRLTSVEGEQTTVVIELPMYQDVQ